MQKQLPTTNLGSITLAELLGAASPSPKRFKTHGLHVRHTRKTKSRFKVYKKKMRNGERSNTCDASEKLQLHFLLLQCRLVARFDSCKHASHYCVCIALRCAADLTIDESRNKTCDARWRTGTDGRVRRKNQKRNGSQSSFEKRTRKGQKNVTVASRN